MSLFEDSIKRVHKEDEPVDINTDELRDFKEEEDKIMDENKNWLEPTEVLEYDPEKGRVCMEDPENDWSNKIEDSIGDTIEGAQG